MQRHGECMMSVEKVRITSLHPEWGWWKGQGRKPKHLVRDNYGTINNQGLRVR